MSHALARFKQQINVTPTAGFVSAGAKQRHACIPVQHLLGSLLERISLYSSQAFASVLPDSSHPVRHRGHQLGGGAHQAPYRRWQIYRPRVLRFTGVAGFIVFHLRHDRA